MIHLIIKGEKVPILWFQIGIDGLGVRDESLVLQGVHLVHHTCSINFGHADLGSGHQNTTIISVTNMITKEMIVGWNHEKDIQLIGSNETLETEMLLDVVFKSHKSSTCPVGKVAAIRKEERV